MKEMNQNVILPEGSCMLSTEEMRTVEGGVKIFISDQKCMDIVHLLSFGGPSIVAGLSTPVVASAITSATAGIAALLSAIPGINIGAGVITGLISLYSIDFAAALIGACVNRKGMDLHIGLDSGGLGLNFVHRKKKK